MEEKGCKSDDGGGKPKTLSSPVQQQVHQSIPPEFERILTDNVAKLPTSTNTTQQLLGLTQGLHNVDKTQFKTQAAGHLDHLHQPPSRKCSNFRFLFSDQKSDCG